MAQPTADQLKQYVDTMVDAVLNDVDIDATQLPVANGIVLKQAADELAANPSDENLVGRLRASLLILAGVDPLDAIREMLDVAQRSSQPKSTSPGDLGGFLNGLGTPNLGGVVTPTATAPTPDPASTAAPDPAATSTSTTTTAGRRRRGQR